MPKNGVKTVPDPQSPEIENAQIPETSGETGGQPQELDPATAPMPTDPNYAEVTGGGDQLPPGQGPGSPPPAPDSGEWRSIRDAAGNYGLDLSTHENDEAALRYLVDRAREFDRQQALISQYEGLLAAQQQHDAQFGGQLPPGQQGRQVGIQQQQQDPSQPTFWNPPVEFDPRMMQFVEMDPETGQVVPGRGGNPLIAQQVQQFLTYRQGEMEKFWTEGPHKYLEPFIEHQLSNYEDKVRDMIRQEIGGYRAENSVQQFVSENPWVFQTDGSGSIVRNTIAGAPVYSPEGERFVQYCQELGRHGVPFEQQKDYALQRIQAERVMSGQASPQATADQQKMQFLQQAAGFQPNAQGAQPTPGVPNTETPLPQGMSLEDALRNDLAAEGITDKDIAGV